MKPSAPIQYLLCSSLFMLNGCAAQPQGGASAEASQGRENQSEIREERAPPASSHDEGSATTVYGRYEQLNVAQHPQAAVYKGRSVLIADDGTRLLIETHKQGVRSEDEIKSFEGKRVQITAGAQEEQCRAWGSGDEATIQGPCLRTITSITLAEQEFAPRSLEATLNPALGELLRAHSLQGVIVTYEPERARLSAGDPELAQTRYRPASTFKVPHTLIGLETGVIKPEGHVFKWDGLKYSLPVWNQDHDLNRAMEVSCVPCFQQVARGVGRERMRAWLERLDYGNENPGGPLDAFWLEAGQLQISPVEQVDFLWRLNEGKLNVSEAHRKRTIEAIPKVSGAGFVLRAKTGMLVKEGNKKLGWYVGWLELEGRDIYFATLLTGAKNQDDIGAARKWLSIETLKMVGGIELPGGLPQAESKSP